MAYTGVDGVAPAGLWAQQLQGGAEAPGSAVALAEETSGCLPHWVHSKDVGDVESRRQGPWRWRGWG